MTSIRKRSWTNAKGEKKVAWQVDYRDNSGRRRSKQFDRKKDAEAWRTRAVWEVSCGVHTADSQSVTLEQAAKLWLDSVRAHDREPTTIAAYEQHVRLHIIPRCGGRKLSQLTAPLVKQLLDGWLSSLSRPMATRVFRSFKAIISDAQERGLVAQNVALAVKIKKAPREKQRISVPPMDDLRAIISEAQKSPRDHAFFLLLIFGGLRASEIRGLPWSAIDFQRKHLLIKQRADVRGRIGHPKSRTSVRTIPLPGRVLNALRAWKLACAPNALDLVFPSAGLKPMAHGVVMKTIVNPVQRSAGIVLLGTTTVPRYTLHDFRHAAASMWIDQGLNPKRVQNLMGHSSIQMTFDTYGHLFEQSQRDADDALAIERALYADAT